MEFKALTADRKSGIALRFYRLMAAASLLVPLILFGFVAWRDEQNTLGEAQNDIVRLTDIFHQHALHVIQTQQLVAERVDDHIRAMTWDQITGSGEVHAYLRQIQDEYPQVQAIWLADASGLIRNASQPLPPKPVSVADRDYFQALRDADVGTFIGNVVQARVMHGLNFNLARRRHGDGSGFDGIVIVTIFSDYFIDFWNSATSTADDIVVSLLRRDGAILARAPGFVSSILTMPPDSPALLELQTADKGTVRAASSLTGVERLYAFRKVDPYNLYLVAGVGVDSALAPWRRFLLVYGSLFAMATIGLLSLSLLALRRARQEQIAIIHWRQATEKLGREVELRATVEANVRQLNDTLSQRAGELEEANKELESFSYSVSHDLRAPLRAIDGFSKILLDDYAGKLDPEGQRLLNVVRDAAKKMGQLIDDILAFSRAGRLEMSFAKVDMEALARAALRSLASVLADRKLRIEVKALPNARGDGPMLQRVWANLLENAIKFTGTRAEGIIELGGNIEGAETVYYVKDNGVGFDMQYVGKLFGVFQRLQGPQEFPGTGIGLAIVKRIVARHGGRVWAEGKVDEGAKFYFSLPARENNDA